MNNEISFDQLIEEAAKIADMTYTPDKEKFPKYGKGQIIDEEKSVRWNREEVIKRNEAFDKERHRLISEKSNAERSLDDKIKAYIAQEIPISLDKVSIIFKRLYEDHHAYGYREILEFVYEEIDYVQSILK